ncbi:MAG: sirohydrochlorin chelatase [Campylobacterota bacterium]
MQILLIVAHGSKLEESNKEIASLAKSIEVLSEGIYIVKYAYLELATPSFDDVLEEILSANSTASIKVLPYFLAKGKHVKVDIPNSINRFKTEYSKCEVTILPHLGKTKGLADLIMNNYIIN